MGLKPRKTFAQTFNRSSDYHIARDLAVEKAERHGVSEWPFHIGQLTYGVTAQKQKGGLATSVEKIRTKPL